MITFACIVLGYNLLAAGFAMLRHIDCRFQYFFTDFLGRADKNVDLENTWESFSLFYSVSLYLILGFT